MIKKFYAVKDDLASDNGSFDLFGVYNNDALAQRAFRMATDNENVPAPDLSLYWISDFDTDTAEFVNTGLRYICRGVKE